MEELRVFLGDKFNPQGKSNRLLYQRAAWEQDRGRLEYLAFVREVASGRFPGCDVLDCGSGWAGLALAESGFKPSFVADKRSFLVSRLKQRGLNYKVYEPGGDIPRHTLAVSLDALLTHKDQLAEVQRLVGLGEVAIFNLHKRWPTMKGTYSVDVDNLVAQIKQSYTVLSHKTYNHYAHLLAIAERKESSNGE